MTTDLYSTEKYDKDAENLSYLTYISQHSFKNRISSKCRWGLLQVWLLTLTRSLYEVVKWDIDNCCKTFASLDMIWANSTSFRAEVNGILFSAMNDTRKPSAWAFLSANETILGRVCSFFALIMNIWGNPIKQVTYSASGINWPRSFFEKILIPSILVISFFFFSHVSFFIFYFIFVLFLNYSFDRGPLLLLC